MGKVNFPTKIDMKIRFTLETDMKKLFELDKNLMGNPMRQMEHLKRLTYKLCN